jgi:S-adenosylmethionine synthetase
MRKEFITSESVTSGHPDKLCDQISDAILDELLRQDPDSKVAVECLTTTGTIIVAGEIKTEGYVDVQKIARNVLKDVGYTNPEYGIDYQDCGVLVAIHEQSPDIAQGVEEKKGKHKEQGAGDQGMMYGFACDETPELMPLPIILAHTLTYRLEQARKTGLIKGLRPDGKSQVTVEYHDGKPVRVDAIVIAAQHDSDVKNLDKQIIDKIIKKAILGNLMDSKTKIHINATGKFVKGGPEADTGVTGRKIIVDTYGGVGRHGGGCFSGKDASKVDRSGAYMARHIAKSVVGSGLASKCEVQLSYAIGVAKPTSVNVDCFGTNKIPEEEVVRKIRNSFFLKPKEIVEYLKLKRPIFRETAVYGHFGRSIFEWEKIKKL